MQIREELGKVWDIGRNVRREVAGFVWGVRSGDRVLRREEGIWLDHAYLAEVGGVDWVGAIEIDCLRWLVLT